MTTQQTEALRLADEWQRKTQREADRQNSAYDRYGMGNTPETVDPLGSKMVAELRTQHARITELESQLAQRFDAADVATAAAQGFRDGVASVGAGWISVDERLPEVGVTVLVYEPFRHGEDWPGTVRILFDYICPDYEDWHDHCASHEHFMAVGGANACGPDVTCIGPSEKAPYTHWMPLPAAPGHADGESNGVEP